MMNALPSELLEKLPSAEDVRFYQEHGWYISPQIFSEDEIEDAVYGCARYYNGERDATLRLKAGHLDWRPENGDVIRQNDYVSLQNDEIRSIVFHPLIGAIAATLCGERDSVRLFHDQLVYKPPHDRSNRTNIGWHIDKAYWKTCTSQRMLTAWIPFQDVDAECGTLHVVDGSHRWTLDPEATTFNVQDMEALESRFLRGEEEIVRVPLEMKAGCASFHHCRTIHGSYTNRSENPRIALAVHMQDSPNGYRVHLDPNGEPHLHLNDTLCRRAADGYPDYSDPGICPVLWAAGDGASGR